MNFVTCHDGFTLNDLVSYSQKHNEANNEENHDGTNDNRSWNCGVEGPTDDPAIEKLRNRQLKNFFTATRLSLGLPMILMGDEVRRTQNGNNNEYCQDKETSWFDWALVSQHADVYRFVRLLIARRLSRDQQPEGHRMTLTQLIGQPGAAPWRRWIDTSLESPNDIVEWQTAPPVPGYTYRAWPAACGRGVGKPPGSCTFGCLITDIGIPQRNYQTVTFDSTRTPFPGRRIHTINHGAKKNWCEQRCGALVCKDNDAETQQRGDHRRRVCRDQVRKNVEKRTVAGQLSYCSF